VARFDCGCVGFRLGLDLQVSRLGGGNLGAKRCRARLLRGWLPGEDFLGNRALHGCDER
jgi:hypothetical protein